MEIYYLRLFKNVTDSLWAFQILFCFLIYQAIVLTLIFTELYDGDDAGWACEYITLLQK